MASRPSHRDAGQQRAEKYKERLKSNVKAAPTFVDTISACQCHNAGINTCTICRRPPHARADVAPDALTTLVKRTTQKPWVLPVELVKAAVDRIQCATCRVAVQHRIIQLSQAGGIQFQGLRWSSAKALVPARSNGTDRNALAMLAQLSSDGAMSPTLVSNIVNFYYLEQPRVEAGALAGVTRMLDSLGKKWRSAHNARGFAGSARKMAIGTSSCISDDFEVAWFQAIEKLVQARTLMLRSVWTHMDFRHGYSQIPVDLKRLSSYDRVRGAYEDDLRQYLQWFKNRHDGTNTEADRTVNAPPFPAIDLSAIPSPAGHKGGVDGDSANPTLLISQLENALSFWIEALTDLHRAVLSVVDFLAFVEAHTRAEAAAARADDVIADHKYIQQDEMSNRLPGVSPDMSLPPGSVRKAASEACRRELAEMDKSRLTHLRSMEEVQSQLVDALHRGGAQGDSSGMAAFSLRPGMRDASGSVGGGSSGSGSSSRGGAGGRGSTGSGGVNEAAPPPPPERERYKFIKTVEERAGSGEEWVGECLAWFVELGEYVHALIGATIEAHEYDTRSVLEAMAKRRLGASLTQEQLMVVMAPGAGGKGDSGSSGAAGVANGKSGGGEVRRRKPDWYNKLQAEKGAGGGGSDVDPELGTSDLVSNEDILRAQGRSGADLAYTRGGSAKTAQQQGGEGEARQAGDTQPQDSDMCKEEILAWQQVILLRSRLLTRPRGMGSLVFAHLDFLLFTYDSYSKPLRPESDPSFMGMGMGMRGYQLDSSLADDMKMRFKFSRDSIPPMQSAETRAPRRAGQMEKVSDYITDAEWKRAFAMKHIAIGNGRAILPSTANWTCRPFSPSMAERTRGAVEHLHEAKIHSPPAFGTELSPMRVVLEKLSTAYNMPYSALRTIMRRGPSSGSGTGVGEGGTGQDSLRLPTPEVQAAGRAAAAAMDAETTPLLSEAERQGYSRLPDSDDWDTSVARAPPASPVDAMVAAAGGLNSVVTGPLFKYLDIQPVLDCYETCMQLSRQALLESFKAHLPPVAGEKPVNFQLLSSQLWYSAVEFNHRLATLRGRIAAVVAKRDATDKTAWLQPSPLVPNLINLHTAAEAPLQDVAKSRDSPSADVDAGCTHTQWELRWDEDASASAHRKTLVWGEGRVKEPPPVPEAQAGASDEVSGTDAEGVVVPICVPLLEPEAIALALQLESVLQEAAAKIVCMPSMATPGLHWLAAEYLAEPGHYDAPLADKLTKVKLISKPFTEDRNLIVEKSTGPSTRTRLADLWYSTEEDFIMQCVDPRNGARWYPYSYAYAKMIYLASDTYARVREKFLEDSPASKVRRLTPLPSDKGSSDVAKAVEIELKVLRRENPSANSSYSDYLLFESQFQRYDMDARGERFMGVPLVGCTDYRQYKQGYIRTMQTHPSKYMEGAFERELKPFGSGQMFRTLWVEMPVSEREQTWYRGAPAGTDLPRQVPGTERIDALPPETQHTSLDNDDRDGYEREVSRFLPRARGIVNNGIHLSWPPEDFALDPAATVRDHPLVASTMAHQHPNTWSSTAVIRQDAPSDFLEWASRVDDTTRRSAYVWTKMWARLVSTYSAVMRAWYGLTTYVAVGTLRRPMLCLGTSVTDKRIEAVIREALRVQLLDEATQLAADSLISEEINDTTAESAGKKGAKKSKAKAAGGSAGAALPSSSAPEVPPSAPATLAQPPAPVEAPAPPPPAPPARATERPAATSTGKGKGSSMSTAAPTPAPVVASASSSSAASSFVSAQGSTGRNTHSTMKLEEEEAEWERAGPSSKGKAPVPASAGSSGAGSTKGGPASSATKPTASLPGKDKVKQEPGSRKNAEAAKPVVPAPSAAAPSGPAKVTPAGAPAATVRAPATEQASAAATPAAAPASTSAKAPGKPMSFAAALSAPKTASAPVPATSVPAPVPPQVATTAAGPSSKANAGSASVPAGQAPSAASPAVVEAPLPAALLPAETEPGARAEHADAQVDKTLEATRSAAAADSAKDTAAATPSESQDSSVRDPKQADAAAAAAKQSEASNKRKPLNLRADSTPFLPPAAPPSTAGSADTSVPPAFAPGGTVPVQSVPVMMPGMVPGFVPSLVAPMVMASPSLMAAAPAAAMAAVPTGGAMTGLQQQRMMGTFQGPIPHGVQQGSVPTPVVTPPSIPGNTPGGVAAGSAVVAGEGAQAVGLQQAPPSTALQPQGQMQNVQQQMMQQQQQQQLMYMQYMQAMQAQAQMAAQQHQQAVAQGQAHAAGKAVVPGPSPSPSAEGPVGQAQSGAADARSSPTTLSPSPSAHGGQGSVAPQGAAVTHTGTVPMQVQPIPAVLQGQGARTVSVAAPFVPAPGSQMPGSLPHPIGMQPGGPAGPVAAGAGMAAPPAGPAQPGPMQPAMGQLMPQGQQQTPRGPSPAMQVPSSIMANGPRGPVSIPVPPQIQGQLSSMQASAAYLAGELAQMNQMGQAQAAAGYMNNQFLQMYQAKQAQLTMVQSSFQAMLNQMHQLAQAQAQGQLQAMPGQQIQGQLQGQGGATAGPVGAAADGGGDATASALPSAPSTSSSSSSNVAAPAGASGPAPTAVDTSSGGSSQVQGGQGVAPPGSKKAWAAVAGGSSATPSAPAFSGAKYMPSTDKDAQVAAALQAREDAAAAQSLSSSTALPLAHGDRVGMGDGEEGQGEWETQGGKKAKVGSKQAGKDSRGGTGSSSRGSVGGAGQGSGSRRGSNAAGHTVGGGGRAGGASTDSVGLSNRYGANNCYLNTVAQALYRLTAYRSAVQARYPRLVEGYKGPKPGQRVPGSEKEGAAAELLTAVLHTFAGMDAAATGAGHAPAVSSVEPLKRALIRYLDARSGTTPGSAQGLEQQLTRSAMGDAAETFEEVITLAHEAEVLVSRALRAGGSGSKGGASLEDELALDLPVAPDTPAPSAALEAFGMVQEESAQCSECKHVANSSNFTGLGLLCNVADLVRLKRPPTSSGRPHFDSYLREVSEGSETRSCPACREATGATRQLKCHRVLRRATKVVSVVLGWASPREPSHVLSSCLDMLDGVLDLRAVFHGMEGLPVQPAKLKAMICYTELHWVAFFATEQGKWLCANDELVFSVESPIVECRSAGLQPSLLFYESQLPGDPFPEHRGRPALHGAAAPAINAAAVAAQSPALPSRAAAVSLGEGWPPVTIVNKPLSAVHHGHEGSWGDMMMDAGNGLDAEEQESGSPGGSAGVGGGGPSAGGGGPSGRTSHGGTHGVSHSSSMSSSRQAGGWAVRGGGGPGPRPAAGSSSGPRSSQGSSGGGPRERYQYLGGGAAGSGAATGPGAAVPPSGGPAPPSLQFQGGASRGGQGSRGSQQGGRGGSTPTGGFTPQPASHGGGTPRAMASSALAGGHASQNSPDRAAQGGSWRGTSSWASQRSAGNGQSGAPAQ